MPIRRLPEDGAKPPLARGTACHRCFARKVRCSGQPDPETGLHACAACLRTARFKGHELAHCRCAFGSEGLCSEEGGPNLLGEIYPNAGPAPRRKLTSRSSTSSSRTSLISTASSSMTDVSLASTSATSLHSLESPLVSSISPTSSLLSLALDKTVPPADQACPPGYPPQPAPPLYGPLGTGFTLPPPVPLVLYAHMPALSAAPLYTPHLGSSMPQQQHPAPWPRLMQEQQQQQQQQQQQHPFLLPQFPQAQTAAPVPHGYGARSISPLVVPGFAPQMPTPVSPGQQPAPPPQRPSLAGPEQSSKSLLARRTKAAPMSIALPPPPVGNPISPAESRASSRAPSRAPSPMHVPRSASLERPATWAAQQQPPAAPAGYSMSPAAIPLVAGPLDAAVAYDRTPPGHPVASAASREMPTSAKTSTNLALPSQPAYMSGVPSPGLLLPGFGSSLHLPESGAGNAMYAHHQQPPLTQNGHYEMYPPIPASSVNGSSYVGGLVTPAPSCFDYRGENGQPLDVPMSQGPGGGGEPTFDMSEWTGSFHLYSPGLTFSSSTPHWFAAQPQETHYFAR